MKAQEDAYHAKTEDLKRKSEEGGVVSRNKAKNQLAQHLGEDPLPLRRAKITQEAAVKRADRATKAAAAAREAAVQSRAASEEAKAAAEAAVEEAAARVAEAEEYLRGTQFVHEPAAGSSGGDLWCVAPIRAEGERRVECMGGNLLR